MHPSGPGVSIHCLVPSWLSGAQTRTESREVCRRLRARTVDFLEPDVITAIGITFRPTVEATLALRGF